MNLYKNKTILITGASSGIGEAFAKRLNELGANLILTARNEEKLNSLSKTMSNALVISGDLSKPSFPKELYDAVKNSNFPSVDILINNAGFGYSGLFLDSNIENYKEMLYVNIYSLTELTHLFLKDMLKKESGGIINISSLASFQSLPYFTVYSSSKAYVTSFTLGLYEEYRDKGIKVLAVCPGYTKTNFNKRAEMQNKSPATGYIMTAEAVVNQSLDAYKSGKYLIINGLINRFTKIFMKLLPQRFALKISKSVIKKGLEKGNW